MRSVRGSQRVLLVHDIHLPSDVEGLIGPDSTLPTPLSIGLSRVFLLFGQNYWHRTYTGLSRMF